MKLDELFTAAHKAGLDLVHGSGWRELMLFRELLPKESQNEAYWCGTESWKNPKEGGLTWDKPDFWKESTYSDCVSWTLNLDNCDLHVTMEEGDMVDGQPNGDIRCTWTFDVRTNQRLFDAVLTQHVLKGLRTQAYKLHLRRQQAIEDAAVQAVYMEFFMPRF